MHFIIPDEYPGDGYEHPAPNANAEWPDAAGTGYGGAILCENGSSPTFSKCVIENCRVVAAQGGNGLNGPHRFPRVSQIDGYWGGHAGHGTGTATAGPSPA